MKNECPFKIKRILIEKLRMNHDFQSQHSYEYQVCAKADCPMWMRTYQPRPEFVENAALLIDRKSVV